MQGQEDVVDPRQADEAAVAQALASLMVHEHAPAQAGLHAALEGVEGRGGVGRRGRGDSGGAQHDALEVVLHVEPHHRHGREVDGAGPPVPLEQGARGHGDVPHVTERLRLAARHGDRLGGDGGQHLAPPQQLRTVVLVLHVQVQHGVMPGGGIPHHGLEPRAQGVRGHGERGDAATGRLPAETCPGLLLEDLHVPGHAHEGRAGIGRHAGAASPDHHLADGALERANPLAHGGRADAQRVGRPFERALVDDGQQSAQLLVIHEAELRQSQDDAFVSDSRPP